MSASGSREESVHAGLDVGGTAVKYGLATRTGRVLAEGRLELTGDADAGGVFASVGAALLALGSPPPTTVGVGLPGLLDRERGVVVDSPNLPWLTGAEVRRSVAESLALPMEAVRIENDANVAALGERWVGAARDGGSALLVTLGTGIGGALLLAGELYIGAGLAGELGHVKVEPEGRRCGCGGRGCLETLASARAASRRAREAGLPAERPGDLEVLASAARATDGPERALLEAIGQDLGHGVASAVTLLDVRRVLIGGGFAAALDVLRPGIERGLSEWVWGGAVRGIRVEAAALGPSAGWLGAAHLGFGPPTSP